MKEMIIINYSMTKLKNYLILYLFLTSCVQEELRIQQSDITGKYIGNFSCTTPTTKKHDMIVTLGKIPNQFYISNGNQFEIMEDGFIDLAPFPVTLYDCEFIGNQQVSGLFDLSIVGEIIEDNISFTLQGFVMGEIRTFSFKGQR